MFIRAKRAPEHSCRSFQLRPALKRPIYTNFLCQLLLTIVFGAVSVTVAHSESSFDARWDETLNLVREDFPRVRHISTDELADLIEQQANMSLLDIREPEEYQVSHIKGAVLARDVGDAIDVLKNKDREALVVVYCSVGYRSSNIANKLARRGYTNVFNVEGSLFKWANENRPIHRGENEATRVHPYDREWGRLLKRKYWSNHAD